MTKLKKIFRKSANESAMKRDLRIGNFFIHEEGNAVKIYDLNDIASHRISLDTPRGQLIKMLADACREGDKGSEAFLHNYIAVAYNFLCVIPDDEFNKDVVNACSACLERHKDIYNMKEDISAEEDEEILRKQEEIEEAKEQVRKDMEEGRI